MRPLFFLLAVILALASAFAAPASWGPSGCAVAQAVPAFTGWQARADEPHIHGYFVNGIQVAGYNSRTRVFRSYDAARNIWGKPERAPWAKTDPAPCKSNCQCEECEDGCECPKGRACGAGNCGCLVNARAKAACACNCGCGTDCPCAETGPCEEGCSCQATTRNVGAAKNPGRLRDCQWAEADGTMNYGLDRSKLKGGGERASINGRPVTKQQLFEALAEKGSIPDDANLLRLTVVADDAAALAKVRASLGPALADLAPKLVIQWYTKDNWALRPEYGFRFDALPAVLLQEPEKPGKRGGKAILQAAIPADPAPLVAAVRARVDGFDPKKVPDLSPDLPGGIPLSVLVAAGLALVVGVLIFKR